MFRTLFCLLVLAAVCGPVAFAEEGIELRWRFAAGETFRILTEVDLVGKTLVGASEPSDANRQVERCLYEVRVASVGADGTGHLAVRFLALEVMSKDSRQLLRFRCQRGENGWESTLASSGPEEDRARARAILSPVLTALADTPIHLEVAPSGAVVRRKASPPRDPFEAITRDLDAESRKILVALRTKGGAPVAEIRETLDLVAKGERLANGLEITMRELFRITEAAIAVDVDLSPAGGARLDATTLWDVAQGRASAVTWEGLRIPMKGALAIRIMGEVQEIAVEFLVTGSVRVRFGSEAELPALPDASAGKDGRDRPGPLQRAKIERARAQLANFSTAISMFYIQHRRLPASLESLAEEDERTGEPFMDRIPEDPWGGDYELRTLDARHCQLISHGPDGEAGTPDDIVWPWPR